MSEPSEIIAQQQGGRTTGSPPNWQRTLYACWIAQLLSIIGFSFVMPFIPFYVRELGVTEPAAVALWSGLVIFAAGITQAIFAPVWGSLADRYGRKIMVKRAMFGGAVVMTLMGFAGSVWHLFALRALQGALTGTVVASTTLVASVTPNGRMGFSLGMMQVAVLMGVTVGPLTGGLMADAWGYRVPFYAAGAVLLVGGLIVQFLAYENFCAPDGSTAPNHGLRQAFGRKGLLALLAAFFTISLAGSFVGPIFPLLVEAVSDTERIASTAGGLLAISGFAAGGSALIVGLLGDRLGHKPVLVGCTIGAALFSAPHAVAQTVGQLALLRVGTGMTRGGTAPALNAIVGQAVSSDTYGRAFGHTRVASALGMAFGPLLGGIAAANLGLRWPFVIMSGLLTLAAALVWRWVQPSINGAVETAEPPEASQDQEAAT
ncbi:MAG: MFS transporter [Armatimonadota bacterium]|jgi:DHA1 family multidrug resistance protein-like MFS transporter